MITITQSGSFSNTERYLSRLKDGRMFDILDKYGNQGANALSNATPRDSGLTAESWTYRIEHKGQYHRLIFENTNSADGIPVAIMIQYGHGTGTGGYVAGRDYINPVVRPLFDQILAEIIREVKSYG